MLNSDLVEQKFDFVNKLSDYPTDLFSDSFKETIEETKILFQEYIEYTDKSLVKCCVVGNTSTGKSTLINALLKECILYEGVSKATICAAKCQPSSNNEEYFKIYEGCDCLDKHLPISSIQKINFTNPEYSTFVMKANNYLDIYLNVSKHEILQNFVIIDCPGFDDNNLDAISKYCKCTDIIVFCFRARESITDRDIDKINQIISQIGKFQINFIINLCDECDSIDRDGIINRLSPHLTGEDAIFFISALEERQQNWNDERHREFERFKECLQKQKSLARVTYCKVYGDLLHSVKVLLDSLKFTNFIQFSERTIEKLYEKIEEFIRKDITKYYKNDVKQGILSYSNQTNKEISKYMLKQFINDHNLNNEIINDNYFSKRFIQNNHISEPTFSWYEWGDKSLKLKERFFDYCKANLTSQSKIDQHYKERVQTILIELEDYKNKLNEIIENIKKIMF